MGPLLAQDHPMSTFHESLRYLKANLILVPEADQEFVREILAKEIVTEPEMRRIEDIAEQIEARTAW